MNTVTGAKSGETFTLEPHLEIGRGAEGKVFRVRRGRCVKVLKAPLPAGEVERLAALAALSKKLPGFAWPVEAVLDPDTGDCVGYVMLLADGETLQSMLDGGATAVLTDLEKATLSLAVATAVADAHALTGPRVVLGDVLKSANLVINGGTATFVDAASVSLFGYRLMSGGGADSVNRLTTPGYVAPEVLANPTAVPSHAGDRFALAVVLFELLFGVPPYQPMACPAAVGLDADDAVRRGIFPRYKDHAEFDRPTYDAVVVPPEIDELFRAAFLSVAGRPHADHWVDGLAKWVEALTPEPPEPEPPVALSPPPGPVPWGRADYVALAVLAAVFLLWAGSNVAGTIDTGPARAFVRVLVTALFTPKKPDPPPPLPPAPSTPVGPPLFRELFE